MAEPSSPAGAKRSTEGFGDLAVVWDVAFVASPELRQTQTSHHADYDCTWSADKGVEIHAKVRGVKAMIAAQRYDIVTGNRRAILSVDKNLKASNEVVIYMAKSYKTTGQRPIKSR